MAQPLDITRRLVRNVATSMAMCLTFGVFKVTTIAKVVLYVYYKFKYLYVFHILMQYIT